MSTDDEAPAGTGATSKNLGRASDDDDTSQESLGSAHKTFRDFLAQVKSMGTLMPDGKYPSGVIDASVLLAQQSDRFIEGAATKLRKVGAHPEEVESWNRRVRHHLSGRAIRLYTAREVMDMPDPKYLIEGLLERESFAMLYAEPGLGKTFVALSWCYDIALGQPWLGLDVIQGPTVYVSAEGFGGIGKRLEALTEDHERDDPPEDCYFIDQAVDLMDMGSVNEAIAAIEDLGIRPVLVVLDTWARSILGAEENSAKDTGQAVDAIDDLRRRLHTAVLVVHHTGKNGGTDRGSGALTGAVDTKLKLDWVKKGRDDLLLEVQKQKNFVAGNPITLRLERVAESLAPRASTPEVTWDDADGEVTKNKDAGMAQAILEALRTASEAGKTPITQNAPLADVTGCSNTRKGELLRAMVDDPGSPVTMEKAGKKNLYTLKDDSDSIPPTPLRGCRNGNRESFLGTMETILESWNRWLQWRHDEVDATLRVWQRVSAMLWRDNLARRAGKRG